MRKSNELVKEMLKQNGIKPESKDASQREKILRMIQKERAKIRQMKWVTLGLWMAAIAAIVLRLHPPSVISEPYISPVSLFVRIFASFLPIAAVASTILLMARTWSPSRREISLRLAAIEEELRRLEKHSNDPSL